MMNKVFLIGTISKEPEMSVSQGGLQVFKTRIEHQKQKQDGSVQPQFFEIYAFGKKADEFNMQLAPSMRVLVEGVIASKERTTKTGGTFYSVEIYANQITIL